MGEIWRFAASLLPVLVPIGGLIALGRLAVRTRLLDTAGTRGLTDLVFWFLMPALLFLSIAGNPLPTDLRTTEIYFGVVLPLFGLSVTIGRSLLGLTTSQASVFGINAVFGNVVMMGIPVVSAVWGGEGLTVLLSIVAAHSLLLLPLATVLIELDGNREGGRLLGALASPVMGSLRNPIVSSILAAFVWRWVGLPLPDPARRLLELMGQAGPTLALICLGASLPPLGRASARPVVVVAALIKLVVMPVCVAVAAMLAAVPAPSAAVMVVVAAMPTGANAFLLARRADSMMEESAATMVVATLASVVTLSVALALVR